MKLKTSKSAIKRIARITGTGKIMRKGMSAQHRTSGKSSRSLNNSNKEFEISKANEKIIKKLVPYR